MFHVHELVDVRKCTSANMVIDSRFVDPGQSVNVVGDVLEHVDSAVDDNDQVVVGETAAAARRRPTPTVRPPLPIREQRGGP